MISICYNSDNSLTLRVAHRISVDVGLHNRLLRSYQKLFSDKNERDIPLDDINLSTQIGDSLNASTWVRISIGSELPDCLNELLVSEKLSRQLIDYLTKYKESNPERGEIVDYAISKIEETVSDREC